MSRIGRNPIALPQGVEVKVNENVVTVKGKLGELSQELTSDLTVKIEDGVAPELSTGIMFTPIAGLDRHLFIYTLANEKLKAVPKVDVKTPTKTDTLTSTALTDSTQDYRAKYSATESGDFRFVVSASDLAGNEKKDTLNITLSTVSAGKVFTMNLSDAFTLHTLPTSFTRNGLIYSQVVETREKDVYETEANEELERLSGVFKVESSVRAEGGVEFNYDLSGVTKSHQEKRKIGLYRFNKDAGTWSYIGGMGEKNALRVKTDQTGTLAVFYNATKVMIPTEFALKQNYPNPFNPTTTILFDLPERQHVNLIIYNVLGQQIKQLVNKVYEASFDHEVRWNGLNDKGQQMASGIYFYQLITPKKQISKKMVLVK